MRVREELAVLDEQLVVLNDAADDARIRAVADADLLSRRLTLCLENGLFDSKSESVFPAFTLPLSRSGGCILTRAGNAQRPRKCGNRPAVHTRVDSIAAELPSPARGFASDYFTPRKRRSLIPRAN